jgi:hypothetical protein
MQKNPLRINNRLSKGSHVDRAWDFLRAYAKKCRMSYLTMLNL